MGFVSKIEAFIAIEIDGYLPDELSISGGSFDTISKIYLASDCTDSSDTICYLLLSSDELIY